MSFFAPKPLFLHAAGMPSTLDKGRMVNDLRTILAIRQNQS
jgi:hypothetical protein